VLSLLGFIFCQTESSAVIYQGDIVEIPELHPDTIHPTEKQKERIIQRISSASDLLKMARDDIQTAFGENDIWEELDNLAGDLGREAWNVHDLWQDHEEALKQKMK